MPLARRDRLVLRAFSAWSFFVWGVLIRNMLKDHTHGFGFRAVHIGLAIVSLTFAVLTWQIASRGRRRQAAEAAATAEHR
jgi:mannose/fructose/N-acetylgalactosamine-specific phosphotransferase system component IIC